MSLIKYDEKVARSISDQLNVTGITENAVFPKEKGNGNYRLRTLVDETLEYIDPTPNIYTLFVQFNERFFWNVLLPVQVKWSPRMTSCAGVCSFHPRNRECVISLSNPLLKLRPRKDLIETLLHEMIHAYLFLTNNNRDRDGHGPVFQSHMKRINNEAGTNITIYHSFHEEVRLYQQHWWRCNGPCQKRGPYFGTVRRAMNRAPGKNDPWWHEHQVTCGGQFIKVKEPEKPEKAKNKNDSKGRKSTGAVTKTPESNGILNWINKTSNTGNAQGKNIPKMPNQQSVAGGSNTKNVTKGNDMTRKPNQSQTTGFDNIKSNSVTNYQTDLKKLGNSTNNVHGWGTGGPNSDSNSGNSSSSNSKFPSNSSVNSTNPRVSFSGTLGGTGRGRSILLDKFSSTSPTNVSQKNHSLNRPDSNKSNLFNKPTTSTSMNGNIEKVAVKTVICPSCNKSVDESKINQHLDVCLEGEGEPEVIPDNSYKKRKSEDDYSTPKKKLKDESKSTSQTVDCPLCSKKLEPDDFNDHLQNCVQNDMIDEKEDDVLSVHDSSSSSVNLHDSPHHCLICDKKLEPGMSLNEHLEECVASVFNDSHDDIEDNTDKESKTGKEQILEQYPCPICMTLVEESLMNDHVDICLTKTK